MKFIDENTKLSKSIPPQLPNSKATELLNDAAKAFDVTTKTAIISNFVLNLFISGALNFLWGMINCL